MWENIIVNRDPLLLLSAALILLGAMSLLISFMYNFSYIRRYRNDFYQLFKGQAWVEGATYHDPSPRIIGTFILSYMFRRCVLKFKSQHPTLLKNQKINSEQILMGTFIRRKDLIVFEQKHARWLINNMLLHSFGLCCSLWMLIYAVFWLD